MSNNGSIAVIGAGYVGLVNAACLADIGHSVACFDTDAQKVSRLSSGIVDILEPGLPELVAKNLDSGRLSFHSVADKALNSAETVFLCVDTPTDPVTGPNLRNLMGAVDSVLDHGENVSTLVLRSTVPPGTTAKVSAEIAVKNGHRSMDIVVHPEFFQEGQAVDDCQSPCRIVVGSDNEAAALRVAGVWQNTDVPFLTTDTATAEMIKQASNAFLAAKISFINDIARICDATGADIDLVAKGMGLDPRIGHRYLQAGIGFGGSCLPKDLRALISSAKLLGWTPPTLAAALKVNDDQIAVIAEKLEKRLGGLQGKKVAMLGLTFKPDTADFRDSPAMALGQYLSRAGGKVRATDPALDQLPQEARDEFDLVADPAECVVGADAVVLATAWPIYQKLNWSEIASSMSGDLVVDGRNVLDVAEIKSAGLRYVGVGRGSVSD
ncbi:MAG: UDP-glucose/GDP-mannose dehydrogenase family protein [Chloroflexi bacterium]|nr:UDP-glucose/GDP-mannose dehydrogenase family protein [Chloroflexota bacterium]